MVGRVPDCAGGRARTGRCPVRVGRVRRDRRRQLRVRGQPQRVVRGQVGMRTPAASAARVDDRPASTRTGCRPHALAQRRKRPVERDRDLGRLRRCRPPARLFDDPRHERGAVFDAGHQDEVVEVEVAAVAERPVLVRLGLDPPLRSSGGEEGVATLPRSIADSSGSTITGSFRRTFQYPDQRGRGPRADSAAAGSRCRTMAMNCSISLARSSTSAGVARSS
jgi:hypothetical protein